MANNAFLVTLYAEVQSIDRLNGGVQIYGNGYSGPAYRSLPVVNTQVTAISPAQTVVTQWGSVTANSIVEILPMGLAVPGFTRKFLCDATVSTLNTART